MAINLNVIIDSSGILDVIRLLQAAGRKKQLEKESNDKLETKGKDAKIAAFAKQGLDPKGQERQAGTQSQKLSAGEEPTSYRKQNDFFLLRPDAPIDLSVQPQQTPTVKSKFWPDSYWSPPTDVEGFLFEPTGGPNNKPAFRLNRGALETAYLYAVNPAGNNRDEYRSSIAGATLEFFTYIGNTLPLAPSPFGSPSFSRHRLYFRFGNLGRMELDVTTQSYQVPASPSGLKTTYFTYLGAFIREGNAQTQLYEVANDIWSAYPADIGSPEEAGYRIVEPWSLSPFQGQTWYHIALVKKERDVALYINGNLYNQITVDFDLILQQPLPQNPAVTYNSAEIQIDSTNVGASIGSKVHGMRFTPKALYASDFTPPLNL